MSDSKVNEPPAPKVHQAFVARHPDLARAWQSMGDAAKQGPLDERTVRLLKLAVAMGAMREGAVHASVRKALALGISEDELQQVVAIAASTVGMPSTVALFSWVRDVIDASKR